MKERLAALVLSLMLSLLIAPAQEKADQWFRINNSAATTERKTGFVLSSPEVADGGALPKDFTGDGSSATLPLEWTGAPAATKSYAVIMHHIPGPGTVKWYWVLYNIPATTLSLPRNVENVGTLGNNSVNKRIGYAPPHSKGPGPKQYIYTVYALSAAPQLDVPPAQVSREVLLTAMKDLILATAELHVVYTRPEGATSQGDDRRPDPLAPRDGMTDSNPADRPAAGFDQERRPPPRPDGQETGRPAAPPPPREEPRER